MSQSLINIAAVAGGGALGASLRYGVMVLSGRLFGVFFPWGTLLVNVIGSFALGIIIGIFALKFTPPDWLKLFLVVGIAGGFTTFSTFSLDAFALWERKAFLASGGYVLASLILSVAALMLGLVLSRNLS
jgi:fluoride exporter